MEQPRCEMCHKSLVGKESYDLWLLVTIYDEEGECRKTCEQPDMSKVDDDYYIVGIDCCGPIMVDVWNAMIRTLNRQEVGRG